MKTSERLSDDPRGGGTDLYANTCGVMDGGNIELTDGELVLLSLADRENFGALIDRYERPLARYVVRLMPSMRDSVEDILQEVFLKIYLHLKDFDQKQKFSSWIYRITHNHLVSRLRMQKSRPKTVSLDNGKAGAFDRYLADNNAEARDAEYVKEEVDTIIRSLEDKYREILTLWFIEEKRYEEISKKLGKPVGTVGVLIRRAKKKFVEQYEFERDLRERKLSLHHSDEK